MPPELNQSSTVIEKKSSSKVILIVVFLLVLFAGGVLGAFAWKLGYFSPGEDRQKYSTESTPFEVLSQSNSAFAEANNFYRNGQYQEAIQKYKEALATAADPVQEGQIKIKIANATRDSGATEEAIKLYKELAANTSYINFVRAYAVQNTGMLLLSPELTSYRTVIFSGEPYVAMMEEGDILLAARRMFEYASSFYPLAFSELYSANWYATELVRMQEAKIEDVSKRESYLKIIQTKKANGEADLDRVSKDENERGIVPEVYKRRATLLGKMAILGEGSTTDAEKAFIDAMNLYALQGAVADGYMRYYFAQYLSMLGEERVHDLQTVLTPFYASVTYENSSVFAFFAGERTNQLLQKKTLQNIASKDPKFKDLLISLGWTQSDLK